MIKKYSLTTDRYTRLSKHFQVYEFASCSPWAYGTPDRIYSNIVLIDEELIVKLEQLMTVLNSNFALVSSGYRTKEHDLQVGGNGKGQHTLGTAVDISFNRNKKVIKTDFISCIAQSVGFTGIARINDSYIHLDTRTTGKYYGDETKGTNTVTDDFYKYYGVYL